MCYASPDGRFSLNDTKYGRREKAAEQRLQRCRAPLVNSVVLMTEKYPHHKYIRRSARLWRLTEQPKMWAHLFKNPHNFFQNQHFKNDDSIHELLLKSELKSMRLSSILTRTKMSKFAILNQNGSSISTPSVSSR